LVSDGIYPGCRDCWESFRLPGRFIELANGPAGDWGHTPRNITMQQCRTSHILHMDDDDCYTAGALQTIRERVAKYPDSLHMFGLGRGSPDKSLWKFERIEWGNVSTLMIVHKNDGNWGVWDSYYGGDAQFIEQTAGHYSDIRWWQHVIAIIRPTSLYQCGF
jgi:hypothetical protein